MLAIILISAIFNYKKITFDKKTLIFIFVIGIIPILLNALIFISVVLEPEGYSESECQKLADDLYSGRANKGICFEDYDEVCKEKYEIEIDCSEYSKLPYVWMSCKNYGKEKNHN